MPIKYKKYSIAQIFKTSLTFLEYRRFEARRAVVCSLSAYKEPNLPETSSTGRTLYVFYSRCKISASGARVCAERKISIFWVKTSWHFYLSLSLLPSFFFILVQFFGPGYLLGLISVGNVLGNSRLTGLEGRNCRWLVEDLHHHFRLNVTYFFVFLSGLLDLIVLAFYYFFYFIILPHRINYK